MHNNRVCSIVGWYLWSDICVTEVPERDGNETEEILKEKIPKTLPNW